MRMTFPITRQVAVVLITLLYYWLSPSPAFSQNLVVDSSKQYQVIDGFGVNVNSLSWNGGELRPALDLLVDQLGATIFRVVIDNTDWEATNDNADPNVFNWDYYNGVYTSAKFEELWSTIAYLNQKGINSRLMLNFMGPVASWMGGNRINQSAEDEWVEMIASLVYYAINTRNLQIGLLAPMNEPDWDGIEGPQVDAYQYVHVVRKLAQKLDAIGLSSIRLVGPDTAAIGTGVGTYLPEMMSDSLLMGKLDHFGLHNYAGDSGGAENAIKQSAYPSRNFWITEVSNIWDTLTHLSQGPSATIVWDAYDSVYNHAILAGRGTTPPNDLGNGPPLIAYNTTTGTYTPRKAFYEHAQLFKFVTPGSRRIQATETISSLTVYAFYHPSGRTTIVGRSTSGSNLTLSGRLVNLPSVTLFENYQTDLYSSNLQRRSDVAVTNGSFSATISANTVFTLTTPQNQAPYLTITSPAPNQVINGSTVSVTYIKGGNLTGVSRAYFQLDTNLPVFDPEFDGVYEFSNVPEGTHTVTGYLAGSDDTEIGGTRIFVTFTTRVATDTMPPSVSISAPQNGATVSGPITISAVASDDVRVEGVQFTLEGGNLGSEVITLPYLVTWDTTTVADGIYTLAAAARDSSGNRSISNPVQVIVDNVGGSTPIAGLVAAYAFDEQTGTTLTDFSGNGNEGTILGAVWTSSGKFGGALVFDGQNDLVQIDDSPTLDLSTTMTLEAWVYPMGTSGWKTVILKERSGGLIYALYAFDNSNRPPAGYVNLNGADIASVGASALPLNTWSHIAVTFDGSSLRLYVNGSLVSTRAASGGQVPSAGSLMIGGNSVWGEYFQGRIDEVRVYNRVLTAAEIQQDMDKPIIVAQSPPTLTITSPRANQVISDAVVQVNYVVGGDLTQVDHVTLKLDSAEVTVGLGGVYQFSDVSEGSHTLMGYLAANNGSMIAGTQVSLAFSVAAQVTAVSLSPTSVVGGNSVTGTVTLSRPASTGGAGVSLASNDTEAATVLSSVSVPGGSTSASFPVTTKTVPSSKSLTIYATYNGVTKSSTLSVNPPVNQAPQVSITAPANGTNYTAPATVAISASGMDNDGWVTKVELFQGTTKLGESTSSTISFTWNNVSAGSYSLTARATDNLGAETTSSPVNLTVNAPVNQPPVVSITSPSNDTTFLPVGTLATVAIDAVANDPDGLVVKVEFFQGPTKLGEVATSPYSFTWNNVGAGIYTLTAKATDNLGAVTESGVISIKVNFPINQPPTIEILSPQNGSTYTAPASVKIDVLATDPDAAGSIAKVEFYQGSMKIGEALTYPHLFTWSNVAEGSYSLTASATDNLGAVTFSSVFNIIVNPLVTQTVAITSPTNGATYTAPATVTINASATYNSGSVAKIEFYNGTTKLGEDLTSPYSFTWNNVAAGTYSLTAKATNSLGATVTSAPINITVNPASVVFIGNMNEGTATDNIYDNGAWINASRFRAPSNMTVSMVKAKISGAGKYKCAIYADSNGSPRTFLRGTAELTNPASGWQTMNLTSNLNLTSGTYYWLAIWSDSSTARVYYTNNGTLRWGKYNYGSWPTSLNTTGGGTYNYCIYAQ